MSKFKKCYFFTYWIDNITRGISWPGCIEDRKQIFLFLKIYGAFSLFHARKSGRRVQYDSNQKSDLAMSAI